MSSSAPGLVPPAGLDRKPRVVVISGPTGVGKTRVALALAHRLGGEVVSADSVQVYRGLDVGSAKSRLEEREGIPHHLIDIVDPSDDYTAGAFVDDARLASQQIISRGRVPIVVGGTGFYIRWLLNGKPGTPKESPEIVLAVDEEVSAFQNKGDWEGALKLLEDAGDSATGECLSRNDWYRLRRALSILKATGLPRSEFQASKTGNDTAETYEFLCYFLYKRRVDLYRAIDARCEEMLAEDSRSKAGVLAEASWLLDLNIQPNSSPPSRAIGYRQAMEYLAECRLANGKSSEDDFLKFVTAFQKASRNYARRQVTWFRNEPQFQCLDASLPTEKLVDFLVDDYHKPAGVCIPSRVKVAAAEVGKREQGLLKSYVSQNKIFVASSSSIAPILEWIRSSQQQQQREKKIQAAALAGGEEQEQLQGP